MPAPTDHEKQIDSEEARGVVLDPLPKGSSWDTYNKRRVKSCVDCHRRELTEAGTPEREVPNGKWGAFAAVSGARAKAKYVPRSEAIKDLEERSKTLSPFDAAKLKKNIETLKADAATPSKKEYVDERAAKPVGWKTARMVDDMTAEAIARSRGKTSGVGRYIHYKDK